MVKHIVIAGADGPLSAHYRSQGDKVTVLPPCGFEAAAAIAEPVDMLIFDNWSAEPDRRVQGLKRAELAETMQRHTFAPFRMAAILKPRLAEAGGTLALLSRDSATMETPDPAGRYLDRPFLAAAHQLWRCLSVEWRDDGIGCRIVGLPGSVAEPAAIARTLEGDAAAFPVAMTDLGGRVLGW